MAINKEFLGPLEGEEEDFAIEALVFSVQVALQRAMNRKGVSNKELAERLGMTPARVSQIFASKGPNMTVRTIAKIAYALGEDFELVSKSDMRRHVPTGQAEAYKSVVFHLNKRLTPAVWKEQAANISSRHRRKLAA